MARSAIGNVIAKLMLNSEGATSAKCHYWQREEGNFNVFQILTQATGYRSLRRRRGRWALVPPQKIQHGALKGGGLFQVDDMGGVLDDDFFGIGQIFRR